MCLCTVKAQMSQHGSESLLSTRGSIKSMAVCKAPSEDLSDYTDAQADLSFGRRRSNLIGFVLLRFSYSHLFQVAMSSNSELHSLTLQKLKTIALSLERVVASFYGPQCSQTLMTSSTGKAVVTSDGYTILQSINASHPLASMMTKAIEGCHRYTYDGCKTFIIYLSRFLTSSEMEVVKGTFVQEGIHENGNRRTNECQAVLSMSGCVRKMIDEIMPSVYVEAIKHCKFNYQPVISLNETLKCVAKTTLMPHFNPKLCHFLTDIIGDVFGDHEDIGSIRESLVFLLRNFDRVCIKIPDQSYDRSQTATSYIIQREFTLMCDAVKKSKSLTIALMKTTIYRTSAAEEPTETIKIKGSSQINDSLIGKIKTVTNFADHCLKLGINVIITSEGVPQFALDILRARGISVVHYVLKEDITVLESLTDTLAIADIEDLDESHVIRAKQICPISVCGRKSVQLQVESKIKVKNLILCAPTVGLCDQLYLIVQKAVKAIAFCLKVEDLSHYLIADCRLEDESDLKRSSEKDDHSSTDSITSQTKCIGKNENNTKRVKNCLLVVPGGGGFELLMSNILKKHGANIKDTNIRSVCFIISDMLIDVIRVLHTNTAESYKDKHAGMCTVEYLQRKIREGLLLGLDRRGEPTDLSKIGVLEPLVLKIHILNCVLSLLEQLLRVDQIVSVKSLNID